MPRLRPLVLACSASLALACGCRAKDPTSAAPRAAREPGPNAKASADAEASTEDRPAQVQVELSLVDETERARLAARLGPASPVADAEALLAVHHRIIEGWHIYWQNPGESGLGTRLTVEAEGARVGPVLYPAPDRFTADGGQVSYGWGHEAVLFVALTELEDGAKIQVRSDYLACAHSCIPGHAELSVALAELAPGASPATLDMLARVPEPAGDRLVASWSETTLVLRPTPALALAELFPYALDAALLGEQRLGDEGSLELDYRFTGPAPTGQAQGVLRSTLAGETRFLELAVPWPAP